MYEVSPPSGGTEVRGIDVVRGVAPELVLLGFDDGECDLRVHGGVLSTAFTPDTMG